MGLPAYTQLGTKRGARELTYGEALRQLLLLDCRGYRDRAITMAGMMELGYLVSRYHTADFARILSRRVSTLHVRWKRQA